MYCVISELPFACVSRQVFVWNHSYEKVFRLQFHFYANQTRFHMASFAHGLQKFRLKEVSDSSQRILYVHVYAKIQRL